MDLEVPQVDTTQLNEIHEFHHGALQNDSSAGCAVPSRPQTMPELVLSPGNWWDVTVSREPLGVFVFFREYGDSYIGPLMRGGNFHGRDDTFREMVSMFTRPLNAYVCSSRLFWLHPTEIRRRAIAIPRHSGNLT
jgi:hypothetical protein